MLAIPTPAEACSPLPDPGFFPQLSDGARTDVPIDGVIAFQADTYGELDEALALLEIEVTLAGVPVAGAIETIELSSSEIGGVSSMVVIVAWRPEVAFAPSSDYVASISVADGSDPNAEPTVTTLDISTAAEASGALPAIELSGLELAAEPQDSVPRVCCDVSDSCGFPLCAGLELADHPMVRATLGLDADDPMAMQSYVRLSSGVDDALAEHDVTGLAAAVDGTTYQRIFDEAAGNYCFGAELVSLIDGSVEPIVSACQEHGDLELTVADNAGFDAFLEQCFGDPYWEDTHEPYEAGDDTGDSDGGDSDDGGSEGGDAEGGSEGGDADAGDSDDGSDGEDGGGGLDDEGGCACRVDADDSGWPAMTMFIVLGAWLRRRRPDARQSS